MKTLYIGVESDPKDREQVTVSSADAESIPRGRPNWTGRVTDLRTGEVIALRAANCGGDNCFCAVERAG